MTYSYSHGDCIINDIFTWWLYHQWQSHMVIVSMAISHGDCIINDNLTWWLYQWHTHTVIVSSMTISHGDCIINDILTRWLYQWQCLLCMDTEIVCLFCRFIKSHHPLLASGRAVLPGRNETLLYRGDTWVRRSYIYCSAIHIWGENIPIYYALLEDVKCTAVSSVWLHRSVLYTANSDRERGWRDRSTYQSWSRLANHLTKRPDCQPIAIVWKFTAVDTCFAS